MKKILFLIIGLLILFVGLIYLSVMGTNEEFRTCTILDIEDLENTDFKEHDSVLIAANTLYEANLIKEFIQGKNYRKAWSTPVKIPIVFLDTLKGGLQIVKEGGGKQTHSLKVQNPQDILFTLRSVTKDPKELVPDIAETLGLENIIVDGISAQHPYGALLAAELANKAGIMHTHPKLVFVPKQERLGELNEKYGNRIYLLEYETESEENWTDLNGVDEILETDDLQELKMKLGENLSIDKSALIRTRLFDILIGDWDRHAEQWGWAIQKENNGYRAIPIPGDRDNAFFNPDGVIPSIITNKNVKPLIRPFSEKIDHMPGLVYPFDQYFLHDTPVEIYVEQAKYLQQNLTDKEITEAFEVWPEQIRELNEQEISEKIRSRRNDLENYAKEFHEIIKERDVLKESLKGSEDLQLDEGLLKCFECG